MSVPLLKLYMDLFYQNVLLTKKMESLPYIINAKLGLFCCPFHFFSKTDSPLTLQLFMHIPYQNMLPIKKILSVLCIIS